MSAESDAVERACDAWALEPTQVTELQRGENVVFRVDLPGGERRVLRLHRPGYNTLDQLECEVEWVQSLAATGLPVPLAVPTTAGPHYVAVDIDGRDHHVGMVEWVDGAPLNGGDPTIDHFRQVGELAARIRAHSTSTPLPSGFDRRRWDTDGFVGETPLWGRFWEADVLDTDQRAVLAECRAALAADLAALSTGPDRFGLIHADLHLGNLMADGDRVTIIDFDDAGFSWFMYELAVALRSIDHEPWYPEARVAMLAGYRSVVDLDPAEEATIDLFIMVRAVLIVGWLDQRKDLDYYTDSAPGIAAEATEMARRYLAGRATSG